MQGGGGVGLRRTRRAVGLRTPRFSWIPDVAACQFRGRLMTASTTSGRSLTSVRLRPYQRECLEQILKKYRSEKRRRILISLPTGTGKTLIFAQFPSFFQMQRRLLVLAHRDELIEQAVKK